MLFGLFSYGLSTHLPIEHHSGFCLEGREVALILSGLKLDCKRENQRMSLIGEKVSRQIGASGYIECSALSTENVYSMPEVIISSWKKFQKLSNKNSKKNFITCSVL